MMGPKPNINRQKTNLEKTQTVSQVPITGFGHIIVPSDVDRDEYVRFVHKSGQCMVLDNYGALLRNVLIPKGEMQYIRFPEDPTQLGSLIGWMRVKEMNAYAITNVYFDGKELGDSTEHRTVHKKSHNNRYIVITETTGSDPMRTVSVRGNTEGPTPGGHQIDTKGGDGKSTQFTQDLEGRAALRADRSIDLEALESFTVRLGKDDEEYGILNITKEGVLSYTDRHDNSFLIQEDKIEIVNGTLIQLGAQGTEFVLKGESLASWLESLCDAIVAITVPTNSGPSLTPVNAPVFTALKEQVELLKSQLVKTQ